MKKIHLGEPYGTWFDCRPLENCGTTSFVSVSFHFHQLTYWATGGGIYDWAIGVQSGGSPNWVLSLGVSQAQEYSALVLNGTPEWSSPFAIGDTDPVHGLPTLLGSYAAP